MDEFIKQYIEIRGGVSELEEEEKSSLISLSEAVMLRYGGKINPRNAKELAKLDHEMGHFAGRQELDALPEGRSIKAYMDGYKQGSKEAAEWRKKYEEYQKNREKWENAKPNF